MDKIKKFLKRLSFKQALRIYQAMEAIKRKELKDLDTKKMKGKNNFYRVRIGSYRIIFQKKRNENIIVAIKKRDDRTYTC